MQNYMKTIISAIKNWVSWKIEDSVATEDDILDALSEMSYIDPITAQDGSIYTNKNGEIYIL